VHAYISTYSTYVRKYIDTYVVTTCICASYSNFWTRQGIITLFEVKFHLTSSSLTKSDYLYLQNALVGTFGKLRKPAVSCVMSVCLSAWNISFLARRKFMKFYIRLFFRKIVEKSHFPSKCGKNIRYFTWRLMYICGNFSLNYSQSEKCFRQNLERKSKYAFCLQYFFFSKIAPFFR